MRYDVGPIEAIPGDHCIAIADGQAVVVRVGDEVRCYANRCLHQDSQIAGGIVRNGVLSCPLHFWRYRVDDGALLGTQKTLASFPVQLAGGTVVVELPDTAPRRSLRDELLERARAYDRDTAWRELTGGDSP